MTNVLLAVDAGVMEEWRNALLRRGRELGVAFDLHTLADGRAPEEADVLIVSPKGPIEDYRAYRGSKLIQSVWAGVEAYIARPDFPHEPTFCRMVDNGLTIGMTDYICGHVLRYHLGLDRHIRDSATGVWAPATPPLSTDRKVGVLGLGALGRDAAEMLVRLRFDVAGWSRTPKDIPGVACHHGADGLHEVLSRSEIIVTILPSTSDTRHILNADTLALAPRGACIINSGRGPLIDDEALLAALGAGQIGHATLDVFDEEPLPKGHPFWNHPQVTVTPHVAAETRTDSAARVAVEQIGRLVSGAPLLHVVDTKAGY